MDEKPDNLAVHIEDVASEETWTPAEEQRVRRSLDYHIVPIVFILYLLCFLDRWVLPNWDHRGRRANMKRITGPILGKSHDVEKQAHPKTSIEMHVYKASRLI